METENIERRYISQEDSNVMIEDRGEGKKAIKGLGIVFNKRSLNLGGFVEIIKPEAVKNIDWNDTVSMTNHDPNHVLGRSPKTMKATVTKQGVEYNNEPSEATDYKDLVIKIERGDIKGSSFGFRIAPKGDNWYEDEEGVLVREVNNIQKVYDLSPVAFPAYPDTNGHVSASTKRSMDEFIANKEEKKPENEDTTNEKREKLPVGLAKKQFEVLQLKNQK